LVYTFKTIFNLIDIVRLIYSSRPLPNPTRVRFYKPDQERFWAFIAAFRVQLDAGQRVLNPGFVPALRYIELYTNAFMRSFMLSCYYDLYKEMGVCPPGFSPSKVDVVLKQPIPKLILDAIRELIRPQIYPEGLIAVPHPSSFTNNVNYDSNAVVRNAVRLGICDDHLLRFGVQWFPPLATCLRAAWMTGTDNHEYALTIVEGTKREGIEPAKFCAMIRILAPLQEVRPDDAERDDEEEKRRKEDFH